MKDMTGSYIDLNDLCLPRELLENKEILEIIGEVLKEVDFKSLECPDYLKQDIVKRLITRQKLESQPFCYNSSLVNTYGEYITTIIQSMSSEELKSETIEITSRKSLDSSQLSRCIVSLKNSDSAKYCLMMSNVEQLFISHDNDVDDSYILKIVESFDEPDYIVRALKDIVLLCYMKMDTKKKLIEDLMIKIMNKHSNKNGTDVEGKIRSEQFSCLIGVFLDHNFVLKTNYRDLKDLLSSFDNLYSIPGRIEFLEKIKDNIMSWKIDLDSSVRQGEDIRKYILNAFSLAAYQVTKEGNSNPVKVLSSVEEQN